VVAIASNALTSITTFDSRAQLEQASQSDEEWAQQNLGSLLPAPSEVTGGNAETAKST